MNIVLIDLNHHLTFIYLN